MIPPSALVVLDTNVLVYLVRNDLVGQRIEHDHHLGHRSDRPLISVVTLGEIRALVLKFGWGLSKRRLLGQLLQNLVVVYVHQGAIIDRYAEIDHYSEKVVKPAHPMGQNDMWIAATTCALTAYLVTTDCDFDYLTPKFISRIKIDPRTGQTLP